MIQTVLIKLLHIRDVRRLVTIGVHDSGMELGYEVLQKRSVHEDCVEQDTLTTPSKR